MDNSQTNMENNGPLSAARAGLLPQGAIRTDDGEVIIPASRRADGSMRKPIRVRQGYVPQDEVPRYKPIAQRRREQEAKEKKTREATDLLETAVANMSLTESSAKRSTARGTSKAPSSSSTTTHRAEREDTSKKHEDDNRNFKQELFKINKSRYEIATAEAKKHQATQETREIGRCNPLDASTADNSKRTGTRGSSNDRSKRPSSSNTKRVIEI